MAEDKHWQRRMAGLLRHLPWSGTVIQRSFRLLQPRFTIGVVGVLLDDRAERVFLVEHIWHTRTPWGLPGGWIARREDPIHTVEREFFEETGLRVRAVYPLLVQRPLDLNAHMDVVYRCVLDGDGQSVRLNHELLSYRWTPCDDLPPMVLFHEQSVQVALERITVSEVTGLPHP